MSLYLKYFLKIHWEICLYCGAVWDELWRWANIRAKKVDCKGTGMFVRCHEDADIFETHYWPFCWSISPVLFQNGYLEA